MRTTPTPSVEPRDLNPLAARSSLSAAGDDDIGQAPAAVYTFRHWTVFRDIVEQYEGPLGGREDMLQLSRDAFSRLRNVSDEHISFKVDSGSGGAVQPPFLRSGDGSYSALIADQKPARVEVLDGSAIQSTRAQRIVVRAGLAMWALGQLLNVAAALVAISKKRSPLDVFSLRDVLFFLPAIVWPAWNLIFGRQR